MFIGFLDQYLENLAPDSYLGKRDQMFLSWFTFSTKMAHVLTWNKFLMI